MDINKERKMSASDIAGELRRSINKGELLAQDRLPAERDLAERFGAARGTIRRAIQKLEDDGFVTTRRGSGTYVVGQAAEKMNDVVGNASPLELIDARFALEPHMCRLAVLKARPGDFENLEDLLRQMEDAVNEPVVFSEVDSQFHETLAKSTRNELLIWLISQINSVRNKKQWSTMRQVILNEKTITEYNTQHRQIINAIRSREPERAAQLMKDHLESARLSLTRAAET